jgi:hypothetical protein
MDEVTKTEVEQYQILLSNYEAEVVKLQDTIVELIRDKQKLNHKIDLLQEQVIKIEHIKISEGASHRVWAAVTGFVGAFVAFLMSIFDRNDK